MQHDEKDIKFLIRENKQLKDEIQELRDVIKVNKQSIDILTNARGSSTNGRDKVNMTMDAASVHSGKSREQARLLEVIKMLNNQNSDLMAELEAIKQQNDELNTKTLLLQQITDASEKHQQRTMMELQSEMKSLSRTLIKTQDKLLENEQGRTQFDSMSGLMIKYKEVHGFTQQANRFMEVEEQLTRQINVLKATIEELKNSRDRLVSVNINLKNELIKLRATMLMPNRTFDPAGEASLKRLALYFLDAQRRVCEDSDYEDDLELVAPELMVLFPDKVGKVSSGKEKIKVPKINLTKAHEMMFGNQKKIEADLKRRNNMGKTQRIVRLEEQLDFTRRELTRTMLQLKEAEQFKLGAERVIEDLNGRNSLLTEGYEGLRKRLKNYKGIPKKAGGGADLNKTYNVSFMNCTFIDKNPQFSKQSGRMHQIDEQQPKNTQQEYILTEKEEFQIQANNLAYEVAKLPLINKIGKARRKADRKQTLMRSYSNPLLYMEDRKEIIFNKPPKDEARVPEPKHHDETCFDRVAGRGFEENLDDIQL